jgi:hypothetical protein
MHKVIARDCGGNREDQGDVPNLWDCYARLRYVESLKHPFKLNILQMQLLGQLGSQSPDFIVQDCHLIKEDFPGGRGLRTFILAPQGFAPGNHVGSGILRAS